MQDDEVARIAELEAELEQERRRVHAMEVLLREADERARGLQTEIATQDERIFVLTKHLNDYADAIDTARDALNGLRD